MDMDSRLSDKYDEYQRIVLNELLQTVKKNLLEAGIQREDVNEVTENMVFAITAIIDGSQVMHYEDEDVIPNLTFYDNDDDKKLIDIGGSYMHELVFGALEFDEDKDEESEE